MADQPNWQPWIRYVDNNGYTKYVAKPAEMSPVVYELAMSSAFVARAKAWSWERQGGTPVPNTGLDFAPWVESKIQGVAEYWHAVLRTHRAHAPHLFPPVETLNTLQAQVSLALILSAGNPLLKFDEGEW